jgi:hypothetical protein
MDISAAGPQVEIFGASVEQSSEIEYVVTLEIVLALVVEPTNFLHLEIQPHELNAGSSEDHSYHNVGHNLELQDSEMSANPMEEDQGHLSVNQEQNNDQHIGMVLLPKNLDYDPGFSDFMLSTRKVSCHANVVRLWADHFAYLKGSDAIKVPRCWNDFCTLNLMHPDRFA